MRKRDVHTVKEGNGAIRREDATVYVVSALVCILQIVKPERGMAVAAAIMVTALILRSAANLFRLQHCRETHGDELRAAVDSLHLLQETIDRARHQLRVTQNAMHRHAAASMEPRHPDLLPDTEAIASACDAMHEALDIVRELDSRDGDEPSLITADERKLLLTELQIADELLDVYQPQPAHQGITVAVDGTVTVGDSTLAGG